MVKENRYKILTFLTYPGSRKPRAVPVGLHKYNGVAFNVSHDTDDLFCLRMNFCRGFTAVTFFCGDATVPELNHLDTIC